MIKDIGSYPHNEEYNKAKAIKIIKHYEEIFKTLPPERQKKIKESIHDPILCLKKMVKSKTNVNIVKYAFSKNSQTHGRLFAKSVSLQSLPKEFRGALAYGIYHDIDIINAHPTFLHQYCIKRGIKCEVLEEYVNNRDTIIQELAEAHHLDNGEVKKLILTLLNGGKRDGFIDPFLTKFNNELKTILENVALNNPDLVKQVKRIYKNDPNQNGKVVNLLLCKIENETTLTAVDYLLNNGYRVDVLVFDGFMVKIDPSKPITNELLAEVSKAVLEYTGYDVKFAEKPLNNSFDSILKQYDDIENEELEPSYPNMKREHEKNHFKCKYPALYVALLDNNEILVYKKDQIIQSYEHISTTIIKKLGTESILEQQTFINVWIKDDNIRIYDKIEFYPNRDECPANHFNLFNGFKAEQYPPIEDKTKIEEMIEPIIHHLKVVAQEHYKFLLVWFAFILQYPTKKTQVNLIVAGKDGTGKSILFDAFRIAILGEELSYQTGDINELFTQFANAFVKKVMMQTDEISSEDFKHSKCEKLKNMTVAPTIKYEKKGVDSITIKNYLNIVFTTNNDFTVPISQTDRRNVFFKCSDTYIQNTEYFKNLAAVFKNITIMRAFYEYLINYDISDALSGWTEGEGLQNYRPNTEFYKEVKLMNLPIIYRFLSALSNYYPNVADIKNAYEECSEFKSFKLSDLIPTTLFFKASTLYELYCSWFIKSNYNMKITSLTKFFTDFKNFKGIEKKIKSCGIIYIIEKKEIKNWLQKDNLYDENTFI